METTRSSKSGSVVGEKVRGDFFKFSLKSKLFQNVVSLSFLQLLNNLLPLITFPYLVRVFGPEKFGLVNFVTAFVAYFSMITDFGFNFSATQQISICRNEKERLSIIASAVYSIKILLLLLCFITFWVLVTFIPKFSVEKELFFFSFLIVLGTTFTPVWFFQGLEEMKQLVAVSTISKILMIIAIFIFIKSKTDDGTYVMLIGLSFVFNAIVLTGMMKKYYEVRFLFPSMKEIFFQLKESYLLFISSASISLYTTTNIFLLGLLSNHAEVGYFAAADKIRLGTQSLASPISQALYPRIAFLAQNDENKSRQLLMKFTLLGGGVLLVAGIVIFFFAQPLVLLLAGNNYSKSIYVLQIIALLPFIIYLSNMFGIQGLLNFGKKKEFTAVIILGSAISIVLSFLFVPLHGSIGSAFSILATEIFVTLGMIYFYFRKKNLHEV
ncbi:MAG: flippase [Ignavibacteriaceae bacterium]|jgi:PST family polysaccharide transporter